MSKKSTPTIDEQIEQKREALTHLLQTKNISKTFT